MSRYVLLGLVALLALVSLGAANGNDGNGRAEPQAHSWSAGDELARRALPSPLRRPMSSAHVSESRLFANPGTWLLLAATVSSLLAAGLVARRVERQ